MKKKAPSENASAQPAGGPRRETDTDAQVDADIDVDEDPARATLREAPKFDRAAWDAAARVKPPPASPEVPDDTAAQTLIGAPAVDIAAARTLIGAPVPAEIRDRPLESKDKRRSEKSADKLVQEQNTVIKASALAEKPVQDQNTVIKAGLLAEPPASRQTDKVPAAEPSLEGADGAPTDPLLIKPAAITAPAKVTAIVEAVKAPAPLTPAERATRARLVVAGIVAALVVALFIPGMIKARRPSTEALQEAYKSTFRDPHLANPRPDMIKFTLVKSAPCATHPEDSCLLYDLTGPRYSSQMAVYKGADGWTLERHGVEK